MLVDSVVEVMYLWVVEIEKVFNVGNEEIVKFIIGVCNKNDELLILIDLEWMIDFKFSMMNVVIGF